MEGGQAEDVSPAAHPPAKKDKKSVLQLYQLGFAQAGSFQNSVVGQAHF